MARADKFHPPSHLSDLSIAGLMETSGRERRHRYYTVANYYKLVSEEALDKSSAVFADIDEVNVGKFYAIRPDSFFEHDEDPVHRQDAAKDNDTEQGQELKKPLEGKPSVSNVCPKRGRPRKAPSTNRKRKVPSLAGDEPETSGSNEPSAKRRRIDSIDGTGSNIVGMLFSSSCNGNVLFSALRSETR